MSGEGGTPSPPPVTRGLLWAAIGVVLAVVFVAGIRSLGKTADAPSGSQPLSSLGEYGDVPDFTLTERGGAAVSRADLAGSVWIADFIFTRCTGICPLLSARMIEIRKALDARPGVRLVSFSVDPDYDTPEVLSAYARDRGVTGEDWIFLTGRREELYRLIGEGFHLAVAPAPADQVVAPGELITHSDRIVVVDRKGRIRGYWHGTEDASTRAILDALDRLREED